MTHPDAPHFRAWKEGQSPTPVPYRPPQVVETHLSSMFITLIALPALTFSISVCQWIHGMPCQHPGVDQLLRARKVVESP